MEISIENYKFFSPKIDHSHNLSEEQLQLLFDTIPAMIWLKDDKNNILKVNRLACDSIGHSAKMVEGRNTAELHPEEADKYFKDDLEVIHSGKPKCDIIELVTTASGEKRWVQTSKLPYRDSEGKITGVIVFAVDINERKLAELKLERMAQELEKINRDLEQFTQVASHDLQEPLRTISLYSDLLKAQYQKDLDQKGQSYVTFISEGAKRMQKLVRDVLAFSKKDACGFALETFSSESALTQSLQHLNAGLEESQAKIEYEGLPIVEGNLSLIRQVFQNLVGNAIKFRSHLPLTNEIRAVQEKNEWIFSVKDNGIGFDSEKAGELFTMFRRLPNAEKHSGTGIGLATCKKIIERHGGRIWVSSRPNEGTTFFFSIPCNGSKI